MNLALAVGGDGTLHALFHNGQTTRLNYLRKLPSEEWSLSQVRSDKNTLSAEAGSLVASITSSRGDPGMRYLFINLGTTPSANRMLLLASTSAPSDWLDRTSRITSAQTSVFGGRVIYSSENHLRLMFITRGTGTLDRVLRYYHQEDSAFLAAEPVDSACTRAGQPWLALDGEGNPGVIYRDMKNKILKIASRQSFKNWAVEEIEADGEGGFLPSLAFGEKGEPHCVYFRQEGERAELLHAVKIDGVWVKETIADTGPMAGQFRPEILLSGDILRVIFFSTSTGALMAAAKDISPEEPDPEPDPDPDPEPDPDPDPEPVPDPAPDPAPDPDPLPRPDPDPVPPTPKIAKSGIGCSFHGLSFSSLLLLAPLLFLASGKRKN